MNLYRANNGMESLVPNGIIGQHNRVNITRDTQKNMNIWGKKTYIKIIAFVTLYLSIIPRHVSLGEKMAPI